MNLFSCNTPAMWKQGGKKEHSDMNLLNSSQWQQPHHISDNDHKHNQMIFLWKQWSKQFREAGGCTKVTHWAMEILTQWPSYQGCCCCSWLLLYSAILRSQADSMHSHVILHAWLAFYSAFLNIHRSGVLIVLTWLVPHETAAISVCSVYTTQPCTMSLHAKPHM